MRTVKEKYVHFHLSATPNSLNQTKWIKTCSDVLSDNNADVDLISDQLVSSIILLRRNKLISKADYEQYRPVTMLTRC